MKKIDLFRCDVCGTQFFEKQLCEFLREISRPKLTVEDFFRCLDKQAGSGSGISTGIIHKLRKIAVKEGFLEG